MVQEDDEYGTVADKAAEKKNQTEKKKVENNMYGGESFYSI